MTVCASCGQRESHWAGCPSAGCRECGGTERTPSAPNVPCPGCRREPVPVRPNVVRALCARCEWVGEYRETQGDADDDARAHALDAHLERVPL